LSKEQQAMRIINNIPIKISEDCAIGEIELNSFSVNLMLHFRAYLLFVEMPYTGWENTFQYVDGETKIFRVKELNYLGLDGNPVNYETKMLYVSNKLSLMMKDIEKIVEGRKVFQHG
jgi:hypothetical protein